MLDRLTRLFRPENPRRTAELAFSRLMTQCMMDSIPFTQGLKETRRKVLTQPRAVGVLVMERNIATDNSPDFENPIPAVTVDFRQMGVGILLRKPLDGAIVIVAIPDLEDYWRLFKCEVRHQSRRPGAWYQTGLSILTTYECQPHESALIRHYFNRPSEPDECRMERCW